MNRAGAGVAHRMQVMNVPLGLQPVADAQEWPATLTPQRRGPPERPPWNNGSQLVLAALLVPTALALATGRRLWRRPVLLVALVMVIVVVPWRGGAEGGDAARLSLADVAGAGLVAFALVRAVVLGRRTRLRSWVLLPMASVFVACGVATAAAADELTSLVGMARFVEIFIAIPLATYLALERRSDLAIVLGTLLAIGIGEGTLGVYQFATGSGAGFGHTAIRAVGTFGAYEIMSLPFVVTYALLVAVAIVIAGRGPGRALAAAAAAGLAVPLTVSFSRGSWIAALLALMAMVTVANLRAGLVFLLASVIAVAPLLALSRENQTSVGHRLASVASTASSPDQSVRDRYSLWKVAGEIWRDHPATGVGLRNFPSFRDTYAPLSLSSGSDVLDASHGFRRVELLSPHNFYLLVLSELGMLGALAFAIYFMAFGIAATRRAAATKRPGVPRIFGLTVVGVLVRLLVGALYGDLVGGATTVLTAVLLGCLVWWASGAVATRRSPVSTTR
jgi:O-antigen ligase